MASSGGAQHRAAEHSYPSLPLPAVLIYVIHTRASLGVRQSKTDGHLLPLSASTVAVPPPGCSPGLIPPFPVVASPVITHVAEVAEGHELDDVTHGLLARVGVQHAAVPIQELHGSKVSVAHAHDDDGHGQLGRLHHGVPRLVHVADHPVRDDEEDEVLLWRMRRARGQARWDARAPSHCSQDLLCSL